MPHRHRPEAELQRLTSFKSKRFDSPAQLLNGFLEARVTSAYEDFVATDYQFVK